VSLNNPYSKGKLCPVLSYYVEDDWMNACAKCIELLLTERRGHTLVIHSQDQAVIEQFALKKPVARVLVNTPAVYGSMGMTTHLFPAMTLGSGTVGRGITADNVSPLHLIYVRKVARGARDVADLGLGTPARSETKRFDAADERITQLRYLLEQALADVHKSE
ncbi:MAG: acetaldehyde dehydrogenase, partial [Peptococcaceae bacterium]|nr:acetaldehyde dehydrogenase [Peptococcaceae bacterium]